MAGAGAAASTFFFILADWHWHNELGHGEVKDQDELDPNKQDQVWSQLRMVAAGVSDSDSFWWNDVT